MPLTLIEIAFNINRQFGPKISGLILILTIRFKVSAIFLNQFICGKVSADILHKQFGMDNSRDMARPFAMVLLVGLFP